MQSIQLYIDGQRLDTFKDESVSITQSIQNVKDVAKIFTDFTKTFSVPASKTNNKIFKHYYNFDIINGYDARKRITSNIELNHMPFRKGYIKLDGVSLKDNIPQTYKLTFFGETIELVDLFGDDELDALDWLDNFNQSNWNANTVLGTTATNGLVSVGSSSTVDGFAYNDAVIVPLITHTDRLYYNSGSTAAGNNVYYSGAAHGVNWLQLKPAIRVDIIIKAIEQKYNIEFSTDFFDSTNTDYYNLRLWLHRNKGDIYGIDEDLLIDQIDTLPSSNSDWEGIDFYGYAFNISDCFYGAAEYYDTTININTTSSEEYNFVLKNNGIEIFRQDGITGNNIFDVGNLTNGTYTLFLESENPITITGSIISYRIAYFESTVNNTFTISSFTMASDYYLDLKAQTPKIKIIDFLTGLFKMFNLTAFKKDGIIVVKTLDEFYSDSDKTWDISKFVEVSDSEVLPALPYREIEFKYKGLDTFLADNHLDLFNKPWATEEYKGAENDFFYGGNYIVELPFEHMKFERLYDENAGSSRPVQYGWFVNKDTNASSMTGDSIKGQPLLFYAIPITDSLGISGLKPALIRKTQYYIPSNSTGTTDSECINFKAELNEYAGQIFPNTLYDRYYKKYISEIFDAQKRLTKLKAYLPLRVLLNYSLADKFSINGQGYKINSITTNLETGLSELELLNVPVFITAQNQISTTTVPTTTTTTVPPATPYVNILGSTSQQVANNVSLTAEDYNFTGSSWTWSGGNAAGKTTKVITVNESSAGSVTYSVTVDGTYSDTHQITWSAAPTLFVSISGANNVNEGDSEIYGSTVTGTATGSIAYYWTVNGGTISGSSNSSTVQITWNSGGSKSVGLSVIRESRTAIDSYPVTVTSLVLPTVRTNNWTNKGENESTLLGVIDSLGNPNYTTKGFYWVQGSGTPTASNNVETVSGTALGNFEKEITGLTQNTVYSFRAYATNTQGTALGNVQSFTTDVTTVYNYWFVNGCPGTNYAAIDMVIRTEQSVTATGSPNTGSYSVFSIYGSCWYAKNTATETEYNANAGDLSSTTADPSSTYTICTDCTGTTTTTTTTTTLPTGNAYTLRYNSSNALAACTGASGTYYGVDSTVSLGSTTIYTDSILTQLAPAGHYSNTMNTQYWNGTQWTGFNQICTI